MNPTDHSHHIAQAAKPSLSLMDRLNDTFSQYGFMPHGHCYLWKPFLVSLHVASDFLIGSAYLAISLTLYGLIKRINLPFNRVVWCFGLFIGACGLTHFMEIWNLWNADYWWAGWIKVITAIASVGTGVYLFKLRHAIVQVAEAAKLAETHRLDLELLTQNLEETIAVRTKEFSIVADNITQLVWRADAKGHISWYNRRWYEYSGTNLEQMQGWGWSKIHHPDHIDRVTKSWTHSLETGVPWEDTFPLKSKDGEYRWFLSRAEPIKNTAGEIVAWFGTNTDITDQRRILDEQKRLLEQSVRLQNELQSMLENSPMGLATFDRDYRYVRINRSLAETNGVALEKHIGMRLRDVLPANANAVEPVIEKVFNTGETIETEIERYTPKYPGKPRYWLTGFYPVKLDGQVQQVGAYALEITSQREAENELKRALSVRDEFLSIASHELKTPLTSMRFNAQILRKQIQQPDGLNKEKVERFITQTDKQTGRLNRLVEDMLDISRIRTGNLTLEKEQVDLNELLTEMKSRFDEQFIHMTGAPLQLEMKAQITGNNWDRMRLEQVISNLLTNALRYGKRNPVSVILEREVDLARMTFIDQGIGVPLNKVNKIFDRFERAVSANDVSGLGLGLFISKQIITAHEGQILVESEEGKGSRFIVEIPI